MDGVQLRLLQNSQLNSYYTTIHHNNYPPSLEKDICQLLELLTDDNDMLTGHEEHMREISKIFNRKFPDKIEANDLNLEILIRREDLVQIHEKLSNMYYRKIQLTQIAEPPEKNENETHSLFLGNEDVIRDLFPDIMDVNFSDDEIRDG